MTRRHKGPSVWVLERVVIDDATDTGRSQVVGVFPTAADAKKRWRNSACRWKRVKYVGWCLFINGIRMFWLTEHEVRP